MIMKKRNVELTRVNMNLPTSIVEKVKDYAIEMGLNTTSAYTVLLKQALEQKNLIQQMPVLISLMNEVKKNIEIDGE